MIKVIHILYRNLHKVANETKGLMYNIADKTNGYTIKICS